MWFLVAYFMIRYRTNEYSSTLWNVLEYLALFFIVLLHEFGHQLACRQVGPIRFKQKFSQGEDMFRQRRSLFFKKMQIVRGCDVKRNVLVYMVYSDKIIEGSPKNSTSSVPIMPWGASGEVQKCGDWIEG